MRVKIGGVERATRSVGISIRPEKRGGVVTVAQPLAFGNTLKVLDDSEGSPTLDPVLLIHEGGHLVCESIGLILVALGATAAEVLAREFGNPDVLTEGLVPVLEVLLEVGSGGAVVVDGDGVEFVEGVWTSLLEVLVPSLTIGSVGGGGTHEVPSLLLEGEEVLLDELASILRGHVGLSLLVDLVHAHGTLVLVEFGVGVVENLLLEVVGILPTPEHWAVHELVDGSVVPTRGGIPRIEPRDGTKVKVVDGNSIRVGPAETHLSTRGLAVSGAAGGRRRR